ncbi:unnamed protein product [Prunus armeniaca]
MARGWGRFIFFERLGVIRLVCHPWVFGFNGYGDWVCLTVQETVHAILVDLHRFMGPIPRWGDVKEPQLSCRWVKRAFTLTKPRLDRGAMVRGH